MKKSFRFLQSCLLAFVFILTLFCYSVLAGALSVHKTCVQGDQIIVEGTTSINPEISTYIQYYVGKEYPGTLTNCIYADGINADTGGKFELVLPLAKLKGEGTYQIVFEQNPRANKILPPEHWVAFRKVDGKIVFGEISSMGEISNLAQTFGMETAETRAVIGKELIASPIEIMSSRVRKGVIYIKGKSSIDPQKSTYIQYYIGKLYEGTLSNCIYCDGFSTDKNGNFNLEIPLEKLKGDGVYQIVLEQNPRANKILPPEHWVAFRKVDGKVVFGDISSMGEISNLALTVGMNIAATEVKIGRTKKLRSKISINKIQQEDEEIVVRGKTRIDTAKSTYIQYYVGKDFPATLSSCIYCDGFNADKNGKFELRIPVASLKGPGNYIIALEQNPNSDKILAPNYWVAVSKVDDKLVFGEISSMGEVANLALTVGMELAQSEFTVK